MHGILKQLFYCVDSLLRDRICEGENPAIVTDNCMTLQAVAMTKTVLNKQGRPTQESPSDIKPTTRA